MTRHLGHRHTLGQSQDLRIEIELALRPAIAAVTSRSFPSGIMSPIVTGLDLNGCGLRRLLALFRSFPSSGSMAISFEIRRVSSLLSRLSEAAFAPSGWP
jgi:hypothetical protein